MIFQNLDPELEWINNMVNNKNSEIEKNFCIDCNHNYDKDNKEQCLLHNEQIILILIKIFLMILMKN